VDGLLVPVRQELEARCLFVFQVLVSQLLASQLGTVAQDACTKLKQKSWEEPPNRLCVFFLPKEKS